ncbi:MAG: polysaccharide pyruvyl transferase family protein [Caldilineaceae bacterium]
MRNIHYLPTNAQRIALFGLFGVGNLGNEATLAAALHHLRALMPNAEFVCICADPTDVAGRHAVNAIPLRQPAQPHESLASHGVIRLLQRIPLELKRWISIYRALGNIDLLVVPGTGILDDFGVGPLQMPYDLFRWSLLAKLQGVRIRFMSIGAGPIHHPLSRWLMKFAANCADYRSYRDQISKTFMHDIGLDTSNDLVYPDLVFSLPRPVSTARAHTEPATPTVGLGVMAYYGWRNQATTGEQIYQSYLAKLTRFALWLLEKGYAIRLLIGEMSDQRAVLALIAAITVAAGQHGQAQLIVEQIDSLSDLLQQIAATDLVVATRFHNVLGALMMNKPTISLGYAQKNDVLMAEMGLGDYCQQIESFDVEQLIQHFTALEANAPQVHALIQAKNRQYERELREQYAQILEQERPAVAEVMSRI